MEKKITRQKNLKIWFSSRSIPPKEKSYLSQLMSGSASFGEKAARRLEADYGMGAGYLDMPIREEDLVSGLAETEEPYVVPSVGDGYTRIDIPTLDVVEWGNLNELLGSLMSQNSSSVDGKPRVFGLKIQDDTNEPRLMDGSIVEINIDREPKPGDFVLARYDQGSPFTIKQLIYDGGRTFLKPFNPRYPIITPENLEIIGVVQRKIIIEEF